MLKKIEQCFFIVKDDCIDELSGERKQRAHAYGKPNLKFVMSIQQFEGGKTEAGHLLNFLGIPSTKSFVSKKFMTLRCF